MRLQKFMAHAGIASRRHSEELIAAGRVRVNGRTVREPGTSVSDSDVVEVDGRGVETPSFRYVVLHKPPGVVTTMRDPQGRRTVASLVEGSPRVVPVGRLDYETSGLLLLTNDGDLANRLLHPRHGVDKTYRATIARRLTPSAVAAFTRGVRLAEGAAAPAKVRVVSSTAAASEIDLTIHEGRNREVRRMFEALGHPVLSLVRTRFGPLRLGALEPGRTRQPSDKELAALMILRAGAPAES